MRLSNAIAAVVTGGASGLGEATARALSEHGVKVAIFDLNDVKGEAVAKEIGGVFCQVDVTLEEAVDVTLPIARDLSSEGIRVNTILPGIFNTPLLHGAPQNVKDSLSASVPFPKRLGQPKEYAELALLMITNGYFNGEDVRLDGAIRMGLR